MSQAAGFFTNSGPGGFVQGLTGNTGPEQFPTAGNINIITANSTPVFNGTVSTLTLNFGLTNLLLGSNGSTITVGDENVSLGGGGAASSLTSGIGNSLIGWGGGRLIQDGNGNCTLGAEALFNAAASSDGNIAIGFQALGNIAGTCEENVAIGFATGTNYTTTESSNIIIRNQGVIGDNNTIRIGETGGAVGQQNLCYIAGIQTVNVGSVATVVSISGDHLGQTTITAGTGITVTPGANTITIAASGAGTTTLTVTSVNHAASPYVVLTTDSFLKVDVSGGVVTIELPNAPTTGRVFYIKDSTGNAATNNITVTTVGGAVNIDGATTFVMNTAYESINVIFDGTAYEVF